MEKTHLALTLNEIEALIKIVNQATIPVSSAQSWVNLLAKLTRIKEELTSSPESQ